nr:uncharacterized protein LOC123746098 isoform X1 [Procambarus clarkii]
MDISLFGKRSEGDDDYYCDLSDDDDILCSSKCISSDEDDEKFFIVPASTKIQKKVSNEDDNDDFEREMASELSQTMKRLATSFSKNKPQTSTNETRSSQGSKLGDKEKELSEDASNFYDDVYFDSDDSDPEVSFAAAETSNRAFKSKKKEKRRILTDDELFYDPTMDDKDQEWVDKMRRSYQPKKKRSTSQLDTSSQPQKLPRSDAVLNCPACLTTLCMDCQRHEVYHNQYRAMFVFNCNVNMMENLTFPRKDQKKRDFYKNKKKNKSKQRMKQEDAQSSQAGSEILQVEPDGAQNSQAGSEMMQGKPDGAQNSQAGSEMMQVEPDGAQNSQAGSEMMQGKPDGAQNSQAGSEMMQGKPDGAQSSQAGSEMMQGKPDGAQSSQAGSEMMQGKPDGAQSSKAGSEMLQVEPDGAQSSQTGSEMLQVEPDGAQSSQAGSEIVQAEPDGTQNSQTRREIPPIKPDDTQTTSGVGQKNSAMDIEETCEVNISSSPTIVAPHTGATKSSLPKKVTFACSEDELFHPVTCKICNTKVAVYDKDEVYHFFNIVTSY